MVATVRIVCENLVTPYNLEDEKDMMTTHRNHPRRSLRGFEAEPVGCKPQVADGFTEHLDCYATTAERGTGAPLRMLHDTYRAGFHARVAADNRAYLVATIALALGLAVMLFGLLYFGTNRPAASHIAVYDSKAWCSGFDGLSCSHKDTARK